MRRLLAILVILHFSFPVWASLLCSQHSEPAKEASAEMSHCHEAEEQAQSSSAEHCAVCISDVCLEDQKTLSAHYLISLSGEKLKAQATFSAETLFSNFRLPRGLEARPPPEYRGPPFLSAQYEWQSFSGVYLN